VLGDRHGHREFQFSGLMGHHRGADIILRALDRADRVFDDKCNGDSNFDSGLDQVGNDNCNGEPDPVNHHLGDGCVLSFDRSAPPDQPMLGDCHGHGEL